MNIFDSYAMDANVMRIESYFTRLETQFEMVDMHENIMKFEADSKVYIESGTPDDLEYLYTEAKKASNNKKEDILDKMIKGISGIIHTILEKVSDAFGLCRARNGNDMIKIDAKTINTFNLIWEALKGLSIGTAAGVLVYTTGKKITDAVEKLKKNKYSDDEVEYINISIKEAEKILGNADSLTKDIKDYISKLEEIDLSDMDDATDTVNQVKGDDKHGISKINIPPKMYSNFTAIVKMWDTLVKKYKDNNITIDPDKVKKYNKHVDEFKEKYAELLKLQKSINNGNANKLSRIDDVKKFNQISDALTKNLSKMKKHHAKCNDLLNMAISSETKVKTEGAIATVGKGVSMGLIKSIIFALKTILQSCVGCVGTILRVVGKNVQQTVV